MKLPNIIGITGTNGSGKDTLGELLHTRCGYDNVSVSDILRAELDKQGKEHTRENLSDMSRQFREVGGDGAMAERAIDAWRTKTDSPGLVITSIRTPGEVVEIQQAGGKVFWIDANPKIRYERITAANRGRGATDNVSFEDFMEQQEREMTPTKLGGGLNMSAARDAADETIINDFATLEDYEAYLIDRFGL